MFLVDQYPFFVRYLLSGPEHFTWNEQIATHARNTTNTKRHKYWHDTILHVHRKDWNYATDDVNGQFHGVQSHWRIFPPTSGRVQKKNNEAAIPWRNGGRQVGIKQRNTTKAHVADQKDWGLHLESLHSVLAVFLPWKLSFPWFQYCEHLVNDQCKHLEYVIKEHRGLYRLRLTTTEA